MVSPVIRRWIKHGNDPYPIHWLNIVGLVSFLMALFLIILAGLDIYTLILFLFFGLGGLGIWLRKW